MLARLLRSVTLDAHEARDASSIDYRSTVTTFGACLQMRQLSAEAVQRALDIDVLDHIKFRITFIPARYRV